MRGMKTEIVPVAIPYGCRFRELLADIRQLNGGAWSKADQTTGVHDIQGLEEEPQELIEFELTGVDLSSSVEGNLFVFYSKLTEEEVIERDKIMEEIKVKEEIRQKEIEI
jgi:hypothetical protein